MGMPTGGIGEDYDGQWQEMWETFIPPKIKEKIRQESLENLKKSIPDSTSAFELLSQLKRYLHPEERELLNKIKKPEESFVEKIVHSRLHKNRVIEAETKVLEAARQVIPFSVRCPTEYDEIDGGKSVIRSRVECEYLRNLILEKL